MKALSVRQPWASLIADGKKTLEIRSWSTRYRGDLLICASAKPHGDLPTGQALAVVSVTACRPMKPDDKGAACCEFRKGHFAWELLNVRRVDPFPVKGKLSLFEVRERIRMKQPTDPKKL